MSKPIPKLSSDAKVYVSAVIIAGITVLALSTVTVLGSSPSRGWAVLVGLTLLTGSLTIKIPTISARLSVSEVFVFSSVLWFGPAIATFVVVLEALVGTLWLRGKNRVLVRVL